MEKKRIKLTESDLHKIVENSVRRIMYENAEDEGFGDYLKGAWNKMAGDARTATQNGLRQGRERASNFGQNVRNGMNNMAQRASNFGQNVRNGMNNMAQRTSNYMGQLKQAGQQASNVADVRKAMQVIDNLRERGILGQNIANMVIGNLRKYGNQ